MPASRANVVSSFTVIKGTLFDPTYRAFQLWDLDQPKKANLDRLKATDPLGVGNANWWRDLGKVINRRFDPSGRDRALVELAKAGCPLHTWKPLMLWHMTRDEFLVRDFLVHWLWEQHVAGAWRLRNEDLHPYLGRLHHRDDVEMKDAWSPNTTDRVASGLLHLAVDFDLMTGTLAREFIPYHLPEPAFLYLLHAMQQEHPNAHDLVHALDWRMYLMDPDDVQRELFRLHQFRTVHYEVAGSIAELRLPCASALDYARQELMP